MGRQPPHAERRGVDHRLLPGVFDEIMDLFPSTFIGVGGDECPKDQWKGDPRTQELMAERGLADENALQAWFIARIAAHVADAGRRVFGWDEILEGKLPPGVAVASWRGMTGAVTAARRGFDVVSCPDDQVYLDYRQSERPDEPIPVCVPVTLEDAYAFDPVPDGLTDEEAARVLGGQANLWTEHVDSPRMVDYYAFPGCARWPRRSGADRATATSTSSAAACTRRTCPGSTPSAWSTGPRPARCPGRRVPEFWAHPRRGPIARRT